MRIHSLFVAAPLLALPSCYQFEVSAQAAYAQLALDGDFGYQNGATSAVVSQDIESAFGLGEDQGTPYGRLTFDTGVPIVTISGFLFEETGTGVLAADFGDIDAGVAVNTDFELTNAKASYALQIRLGPVTLAPGVAADYIDLNVDVQDVFGAVRETAELSAPVPLAYLRAEVEIGPFAAVAEGGYMDIDIDDDVSTKLLDLEALVEFRPGDLLDFFVGYRHLALEANGLVDGDTFDADVTLSGFFVGGGLRF